MRQSDHREVGTQQVVAEVHLIKIAQVHTFDKNNLAVVGNHALMCSCFDWFSFSSPQTMYMYRYIFLCHWATWKTICRAYCLVLRLNEEFNRGKFSGIAQCSRSDFFCFI